MNNYQKNSTDEQQTHSPLTPVFFAHWIGAPGNSQETLNQQGTLSNEKINLCQSHSNWKAGFSLN